MMGRKQFSYPNLGNIKKISKTGVQRISVGSITHSSKSFDSSLLI